MVSSSRCSIPRWVGIQAKDPKPVPRSPGYAAPTIASRQHQRAPHTTSKRLAPVTNVAATPRKPRTARVVKKISTSKIPVRSTKKIEIAPPEGNTLAAPRSSAQFPQPYTSPPPAYSPFQHSEQLESLPQYDTPDFLPTPPTFRQLSPPHPKPTAEMELVVYVPSYAQGDLSKGIDSLPLGYFTTQSQALSAPVYDLGPELQFIGTDDPFKRDQSTPCKPDSFATGLLAEFSDIFASLGVEPGVSFA